MRRSALGARLHLALRSLLVFGFVGLTAVPTALGLVLLIPFRGMRIRVGNAYGRWLSAVTIFATGSRFMVTGREHLEGVSGIIVANHSSHMDLFAVIGTVPPGTVGVARRVILLYPGIGFLWWLSGMLCLDLKNTSRARETLNEATRFLDHHKLNICLLPEGTRSQNGRLGRFKKGFAHLAMQTGRPIIPMVIKGAHHIWPPRSLEIHPGSWSVEYLPPISTAEWTAETIEAHIDEVRAAFISRLPEDQRPLEGMETPLLPS